MRRVEERANVRRNTGAGFTLVELAFVTIIGGLLLAGSSFMLSVYIKQAELKTTRDRLATIDEAVQLFLNLNGRYPCPARRAVASDTAQYGVEIDTDCTAPADPGDTLTALGRDGRPVRIGAVPVRTLNIPDEYMSDAWGGRFTYAVTMTQASQGTYNRNEGGIFVNDGAGNPLVNFPVPGVAHYVLVSHGKNAGGAVPTLGGAPIPCNAGTLEEENCNDDATFRSSLLTGTADNANLYDDMVTVRAVTAFGSFIPPGAVMAFNLNACPQGWNPVPDAANRFIVGFGADYANIGETGGAAEIILSETDTPFRKDMRPINPALVPGGTFFAEGTGMPGDAIDNRPPYIVFLFCEKS